MGVKPYCKILWRQDGGFAPEVQEAALASIEELLFLLERIRDQFAADYHYLDDEPAATDEESEHWEHDYPDRDLLAIDAPLGGVGVDVTNRWGSLAEVGFGWDVCYFFRHIPRPGARCTDSPFIKGSRAFWLAGGHHTELEVSMLVSPAGFLRALSLWLTTNRFTSRQR